MAGALEDASDDGARIYTQGVLPDGTPLRAVVAGGGRLSGQMTACMRCHRPSGYGMAEGDLRVPDITAHTLAAPLELRRDRLLRELYQERQGPIAKSRAHTPRLRPGYAGAPDLVGAVVGGIDPGGRRLAPSMPQYALDAGAVAALASYMSDLGRGPDPGIGARVVHFATVVGPGVQPARAEAMLDVMRAFVAIRNREIERELSRADFSPRQKSLYGHARRLWRLNVWQLEGPPRTWGVKMQRHYARQPVFAMLGGTALGDWSTVQTFCEAAHLPCLFPLTDWPTKTPEHFTIHLSGGLPSEAQMIAAQLAAEGTGTASVRHGSDEASLAMAQHVVAALAENGIATAEEVRLADALVLLGDEAAVQDLLSDPPVAAFNGTVLVAGGLLALGGERALALRPSRPLSVAWRYALPDAAPQRIHRLRGGRRARRIRAPEWERTQLNTLLAFEVADHAMDHLVDRYPRELFIETIEHQVETGLNPGTFPRMSLGPGQRFASHGAEILTLCRNGALMTGPPKACQMDEETPLTAAQ